MAIRTNYNAENKQTQATEQQSERSDGSDESESELLKEGKPRAWRETSGPEIGTTGCQKTVAGRGFSVRDEGWKGQAGY